jgi:hypothetical protein
MPSGPTMIRSRSFAFGSSRPTKVDGTNDTANRCQHFASVGVAFHVVEPKGEGWCLWNADSELRTVWRHPHEEGPR